MPKFRITRFWLLVFYYAPFLLVVTCWFVFWILETALTQFYDGKDGQRARKEAALRSQDYVRKSAPGL
jgi:hypothetical protein